MHHIAISIDNNFVKQGITMLNSLIKNNPELSFKLHVLDSGISWFNKLLFSKFLNKNKILHHYYFIDYSPIKNAPVNGHVTFATYSRVFLSSQLDDEVEKVLYLDCDMIVKSEIIDLLNLDVSDYYLGGVPEVIDDESKSRLGFENNEFYFNAGMILVNLKKWRETKIEAILINFIINNQKKIKYWDQDVLNCCFKNTWLKLNYKYNVTHFFYYPDKFGNEYFGLTKEEYIATKSDPVILHFTGIKKPWKKGCEHPMKEEYFKYELSFKKLIFSC